MPSESFAPFGDRVLLRRLETESMYHGVIHLPDKSQQPPQVCTVVSVGPQALYCVEDDKVLIGKYSGTDIKLNDESLVLVKEEDILGRVVLKE